VTVPTGDGPDAQANFNLLMRGKRHDYFTSARPWPAKPTVETAWSGLDPLGPGGNFLWRAGAAQGAAPVSGIGMAVVTTSAGAVTHTLPGGRTDSWDPTYTNSPKVRPSGTNGWPDVKVLVSDIRTAVLIQKMLERDARGGTRYAESIRAHFGVVSPDARLQRPEYLGGGKTYINIHPLAQTSATDISGSTTLLGEQVGIGTGMVYGHGFSQSFTEHGYVIGIVNVRADLTYQQGLRRMWSRRTRYDFYFPVFAALGEQAIMQPEIYCNGSGAAPTTVFGYQERWAEYRYNPSQITGHMRSGVEDTTDQWHYSQLFGDGNSQVSAPTLNAAFIQDTATLDGINRTSAVTDATGVQFLADFFFDIRAARPMPMYSVPGLIDHF